MNTTKTIWRPSPTMDRAELVADAELAAELARGAAEAAWEWSKLAGVGEDDAHEAESAAQRAHSAFVRVLEVPSDDDARVATAAAWAAAESAMEADQRVIAQIIEGLQVA